MSRVLPGCHDGRISMTNWGLCAWGFSCLLVASVQLRRHVPVQPEAHANAAAAVAAGWMATRGGCRLTRRR